MEHHDNDFPATSDTQTPSFPVGSGTSVQMSGMLPQMTRMMLQYYNMFAWPQMARMMPQMAGMSAGTAQMSGMMPLMSGVMGSGMMQGASQIYTPLESQYISAETFSQEELGLSPVRVPPTESPPPVGRWGGPKKGKGRGRGRSKGKAVAGESSQSKAGAEEVGAEADDDDDDDEETRQTVWSEEECVALSKSWINVSDDPIRSRNQRIDNMWKCISQAYCSFKPAGGRYHTAEECRKKWDRLKTALSRFVGLYENNGCMLTSGQTMEDAKQMAKAEFPEHGKHDPFNHWDSYVVLMESSKFRAGVAAAGPKR